ncbi:MAG: type IV toxin-antitoxin system AbiEi family antitoxin domain-containing protein [Alphaproteobacteria bacterium]|nr:type IV toxin-antitoxin system AbiEi family antitoxin domain-containing protein [Alphaproteobacteria bacterium]
MSTNRTDKIKHLMQIWPMHTVATASWLMEHNITYGNLSKYVKSGWVKKLSSGAFVRPHDEISWEGAVAGLQNQYPNCFYVGGRTALELLGAAHFIPMSKSKLFIFTYERRQLPFWFSNYTKNIGLACAYLQYRFLPPKLGITSYDCGEFKIEISSRERAALEVVELLGQHHDFEGCRLLFENLSTLRPKLVQELLEGCTSIKAKRIFLFLSKNLGHKWFNDLDLTRVDFGSGPRDITPGGVYDPEFKITYPRDFFNDDKLEV